MRAGSPDLGRQFEFDSRLMTSPALLRKTRKDFQRLSEMRAKESANLARSGNQQGAWYLGGFAIECALKACIAKRTRRHEFPDRDYAVKVHTHNLEQLLKLAQLESQLENDMKTQPGLATNWGVVKDWKVESRYDTSRLRGKDMAVAVNSPDGVLGWIKLHW